MMSYTNRSCFKAVLVLTLISAYVILALVSNLGMLPIQANLGSIKELQESELNKRNYTISIWKVGARMQRRFLRSFGSIERDPFAQCSVRNCRLEVNDSLVRFSDAVMFHLHLLRNIKTALPKTRPINQQWIFFTDESPYHTFMADPKLTMKDLNGLFNLSMTYRSDSDIPIPYGRTEKLPSPNLEDLTSMLKSKTKGVTILGSNCDGKNGRWDYVHELAKYIQVDIFGRCGKQACPEHFSKDCDAIKDYQFYLSFENSNCAEYLTEKLWYNAYHKKAIPIVMGAPKDDYDRLCPPHSFIHIDDFASPKELAEYIIKHKTNDKVGHVLHFRRLRKNPEDLVAYHTWRRSYRVVNEHGYFGTPSLHLCRMCEMLNKPIKRQTLDHLESWWSVRRDCRNTRYKASTA
ncbi:galactoside 3(4)-L-fucosyltransferase-like isoform X2 [Varroa destructor]|uniref:Fucosyltransferase n=1 Tax=Varroa destructor TaxID=109461 RepID=A0A7M7J686_VARDE|nr:galactoside 3(4)-L-fucosyltransferase-like isoform X2 [Varroa destructor]